MRYLLIILLLCGCAEEKVYPTIGYKKHVETWKDADGKIHMRSVEVYPNTTQVTITGKE